jgi:hypothetical protein
LRKPFRRAVDFLEAEKMWDWASVAARYLGELHLFLGELEWLCAVRERT